MKLKQCSYCYTYVSGKCIMLKTNFVKGHKAYYFSNEFIYVTKVCIVYKSMKLNAQNMMVIRK